MAAEARREDVELGGVGAARLGFDVPYDREVALEHVEQRALRAALEHLGDERAARRQNFRRELGRGLGERHDAQMVRAGVAGRRRGHVGEHHIGAAIAQQGLELVGGVVGEEVEFQNGGAGNGIDGQIVDADHLATPFDGLHALCRDLGPSAGRRAEVDDALAGFEDVIFVVDLDELEGSARAPTLPLGGGNIGIVELAFEPALRGGRAPARRLETHRELARVTEVLRRRAAAAGALAFALATARHLLPTIAA